MTIATVAPVWVNYLALIGILALFGLVGYTFFKEGPRGERNVSPRTLKLQIASALAGTAAVMAFLLGHAGVGDSRPWLVISGPLSAIGVILNLLVVVRERSARLPEHARVDHGDYSARSGGNGPPLS
jgi:hypothetical protein